MVNDPYQVLGISPKASSDEVKKAYRDLSRKYHPDSYNNNPLASLAEEKFKEVQDAYDQIMKEREGGYGSSGYGSSGGYQQGGRDSLEMDGVANYINARQYKEALNMLYQISNRTAKWHYYSALANNGMGNNIESLNHARQAVNMEPGNREYTNLLNQLQWGSQRYQNGGGYGNRQGGGLGTGNLCCDLWCADSLCECLGGDLCPCL